MVALALNSHHFVCTVMGFICRHQALMVPLALNSHHFACTVVGIYSFVGIRQTLMWALIQDGTMMHSTNFEIVNIFNWMFDNMIMVF